jgi:iron complex transport system substrate-binding protein
MADFNFIYNKELNSRIKANKVQNLGLSADINKESLLKLMPEAFVEPAFQNHKLSNEIIKQSGILIIYNLDWLEDHPLGRAEWIKFFAAFTNQSQKADSIFSEVEARYLKLANQALKYENKPDAIIGTNYKGVWYMPSGNSFKAQLLNDAGVNYHWKNTEKSGSLALNFENVLKEQNDAEFWIDIPFNTKKQLLSVDQSYELFNAFESGNLFNNLKRSKSSGANEYWEYAFVRPDILLNDLVQIFHSDSIDSENLVFYQRLENE